MLRGTPVTPTEMIDMLDTPARPPFKVVPRVHAKRPSLLGVLEYTRDDIDHLHRCLLYLLERCDGAVSDDTVGFNKPDAGWARKAAARWPFWSNYLIGEADERLHKYRRQLWRMNHG